MPPFQRAQKITERLNINIACGFQLSEPYNELFGGIDSKCPVRTKCREHAEVLLRSGNILMMLKVITRIINRTKRSEEHTSELQSHLNLVCRLLLEKKKQRQH